MVADGYKNTEIGVIPVEWKIIELGSICHTTTGKLNSNAMVENGQYKFFTCAKEPYLIDEYKFDTEALLISGNGANVGYIHYYNGKFNAYQRTYVLDEFTNNIQYIKYILQRLLKDRIDKEKNAGNTPYITLNTITEMKIPLPRLKEQEKIADILSTADDKIDAIASQIEKAKTLKKGLLQKLLSKGIGHSEFKDSELGKIPASWEINKLKDISKIIMGQSPKSDTYNTDNIGMPLIQGNADCKSRKTIPRTYTTELTKECFVGDIIMTVRAPVGAISKSLHNACIGRGVCSIKPKEDNEYIYHCLVAYEDKWDKLSQGSTFTAVSGSDIKNLKFPLPPLEEQKQISEILSTADEKLEVLRAKKREV